MTNCLFFSVKYRLSHRDSKIHIENHIINIIKEHGFRSSILRYMRYVGIIHSLMMLFLPHFYITEDGFRYDYECIYGKIERTAIDKFNYGYEFIEKFD